MDGNIKNIVSLKECNPAIKDKGKETKRKSQLYFFLHSKEGRHAKNGIIKGKRKLDKGKKDANKETTATKDELMAIKDKFWFNVSFSLKNIRKVYNEGRR